MAVCKYTPNLISFPYALTLLSGRIHVLHAQYIIQVNGTAIDCFFMIGLLKKLSLSIYNLITVLTDEIVCMKTSSLKFL